MNKRVLVKDYDGNMWTGVFVEEGEGYYLVRSDETDETLAVPQDQVKFR